MGIIRGDLSVVGLADLLHLLANKRLVGTLIVSDPESQKSIYFGKNGILFLSDGKRRGPRLGEILLRTNRLTARQVETVVAFQTQWRARFGEAVVMLNYLTNEEMMQAVREQVEEEIYDLFSWSNADFEFIEGPPCARFQDPDQPVVLLPLNVTGLILEALRRIDEWDMIDKVLGGAGAVFAATPRLEACSTDYAADRLLVLLPRLLDGIRTVRQIVEASSASGFQVYRALLRLHQDGCLRMVRGAYAEPCRHPSPAPPRGGAARNRSTVVVVGDIPGFRHELCAVLQEEGYDTVEAAGAAAAIETLRSLCADAVLLDAPHDLQGPWQDLPSLKAATSAPIVVLSPNRTRADILRTVKRGARDYVVKPFTRRDLIERLQKLAVGSAGGPRDMGVRTPSTPQGATAGLRR